MAETDGAPETNTAPSTPQRRRTRSAATPGSAPKTRAPRKTDAAKGGATTGTRRRAKSEAASEPTTSVEAVTKRVRRKAGDVKPAAKRATRSIKAKVDEAAKPANRTRILVGAAAAAVGVAAATAAVVKRAKISKTAGSIAETVSKKIETITGDEADAAESHSA